MATQLPPSTDFTGSGVTEGNFKTAISNLRAYLAGLLGTDGTTDTAKATLGTTTFPAGTRLTFNQTAAPTGWTKDTNSALNDSIMRIVTGTAGSGGSVAFSTFNNQATTGSHAITVAEMPSHTHDTPIWSGASVTMGVTANGSLENNPVILVTSTASGGGQGHTHSISTSVKYYDFIIASKD